VSVETLNKFCRLFNYIFVEDYQEKGQPFYVFLDYHGQRILLSANDITSRLA
jgi:hypothetical protein